MHVSHIRLLIVLLMLTLSANVKASALPAVTGVRPAYGFLRAEGDIGHDHRPWFLKGDGSAIWLCVGYVVLGQVGEADHRCHTGWERHSYSYGDDAGWHIGRKLR